PGPTSSRAAWTNSAPSTGTTPTGRSVRRSTRCRSRWPCPSNEVTRPGPSDTARLSPSEVVAPGHRQLGQQVASVFGVAWLAQHVVAAGHQLAVGDEVTAFPHDGVVRRRERQSEAHAGQHADEDGGEYGAGGGQAEQHPDEQAEPCAGHGS